MKMFEGLDNSTEIWDTIVLCFNLIFLEKGITQLSNHIFQIGKWVKLGNAEVSDVQYVLNYGLTLLYITYLKEDCIHGL